jgi:hypothetical protein
MSSEGQWKQPRRLKKPEISGLKNLKNYDGSWTEYGNLIGAPIEK